MGKKPLKSWKTLASDSKFRRRIVLTESQVEELNSHFENIEKLQEKDEKTQKPSRKIAKQPEV